MGKKKNNFRMAIVMGIILSIVLFGVISYSYNSFISDDTNQTTSDENDDNNDLFDYMKSIFDRISLNK